MRDKIKWFGTVAAIQPRIRLSRSFDQRSHVYLGYALRIDGSAGGRTQTFSVGMGKSLQEKQGIQAGDGVEGCCHPVEHPELESVDFYKVSSFRRLTQSRVGHPSPPPWLGVPPPLEVYRSRGHRRLAAQTYESDCGPCIWGCKMAVEMIIDQWNPSQRKYRYETFCYGPLSCPVYESGPTRKVPGRKGMTYEEEDWVDNGATSHRDPAE